MNAATIAAHEYERDLEAALDYVMAATRHARERGLADATTARLGLAEASARLAFFARSAPAHEVGLADATTHLEAAIDTLDDADVGHLARQALQLYAGHREAVA